MESVSETDKRLDEFSTWQRVEFRCMIQDILGNEVYSKKDSDKLGDRTIFYCITIPGENEWVRKVSSNGFDSFDKLTKNNNEPMNTDEERLSFSLVNYSYPIPSDGKNRSCLIKVYDLDLIEFLRVNDVVQVLGYVEPREFEDNAELLTNKNLPTNNGASSANHNSHAENDTNTANGQGASIEDDCDRDFEPASDFPHRLVPRVHVQTLKKLTHLNPTLPQALKLEDLDLTRLKLARARLSTILTQLFGGDSLAAEYLILSLLAKVYRKKSECIIGHIPMNIIGVKPEIKLLIEKLYSLINRITTHSHCIDLSIANLNNLQFTPQKDHENNKMIAGLLQLPDGLFLLVNELAMSEGMLTQQGTSNLATLNCIIQHQRHKYNFKYHSVDIDTDLSILVMSEGRSVLSVPFALKLEYDDLESIQQACNSLDDFLNEELLTMFRYYISAMRQIDSLKLHLPNEVENIIKQDFVKFRKDAEKQNKSPFSADDLSTHMTLLKLLTLSRAEQIMTKDTWTEVCQMESTRIARLDNLKK